jgi:exonuclease SbcD
MDKTERLIMGGVECVAASAFDSEIKYVALGHIHKAQRIGGNNHIRYSGSPLPMSFSERHYKHQVVVFELQSELAHLKTIEIPVTIPLLQIPSKPAPLDEVLAQLHQLKEKNDDEPAPYLEVQVLLSEPEPGLRHKIETALLGKNVKLARIQPHYPKRNKTSSNPIAKDELTELQPIAVFAKSYQAKYNSEVPDHLMALFQQAVNEINESAV